MAHIIVRWTRVGRHSEGVSHVPACPVVVVVAEADRQHRGPRANPGGRANVPDSGYWRHRRSRNSTKSGSKTALDPALSPGDQRAREPVGRCPPGRSPPLGSQFTRPAHLAARSRRSPAGLLTSARAPSPVPPTPRAPPTSPRAPACFHLLWPRGRSAVAGRAAPEDRWRRRGITPPPTPTTPATPSHLGRVSHLGRSAQRRRRPCGRRRQLPAPPWCSDDAPREPLRPLPRLRSRRAPASRARGPDR